MFGSAGLAEPVTVGISNVRSEVDARTGRPVLFSKIKTPPTLQLSEVTRTVDGQKVSVSETSKYIGKTMVLRLNGVTFFSGVIREPLSGSIQINNSEWTAENAKSLADQLSAPDARLELEIVGD